MVIQSRRARSETPVPIVLIRFDFEDLILRRLQELILYSIFDPIVKRGRLIGKPGIIIPQRGV